MSRRTLNHAPTVLQPALYVPLTCGSSMSVAYFGVYLGADPPLGAGFDSAPIRLLDIQN